MKILEAAIEMTPKNDGKTPWGADVKAVLRSAPPRADDIPDMAEFVRRWGGMPSGTFVKMVVRLCRVAVPSDVVVSGNVFKWLSDLKFDPSELPAFL